MNGILEKIQEPEVRGCPVDGSERFHAHRLVLERKRSIRDVFREFHGIFSMLDEKFLSGQGKRIELGAGVFPVKESLPEVLATDIVLAQHLDAQLDAQAMDLPNESVHAFYLQNVFHHFPDPPAFFAEIARTLTPGGGAILIEPASGPVASLIYPKLFASEGFDKNAASWKTEVGGPMSGANQALSSLIFDRDLARFEQENPTLEIVHRDVLPNYLRYLFSGGLNFRPLMPELLFPVLRLIEGVLRPARSVLGLHRVIVLRKRKEI